LKQFEEPAKIEIGLEKLISSVYSIRDDDDRMRKMLKMDSDESKKYFDSLRKNYPVRREFNNYSVHSNSLSEKVKNILKNLRFKVVT
jgi:erythronate-4-phosphate dehydrogenase